MSKIYLKSSDNKTVEFSTDFLAKHSVLVENMFEKVNQKTREMKDEMTLPFHNIHSETMELMRTYLSEEHVKPNFPITFENRTYESVFKISFQRDFFRNLTDEQLRLLTEAATFMDVPKLYEACCSAVAIRLKAA